MEIGDMLLGKLREMGIDIKKKVKILLIFK